MAEDENTEDVAEENATIEDGEQGDAAAGGDAGSGDDGMSLEEIHDPKDLIDEAENFEIGDPMVKEVEAIYDVPVQISAVLGRSTMQVSQLLKLGRGAVVELDRKVGEAIDIYVNDRLVARGEVMVVEDKLGITMTEIVKSEKSG